MTLFLALAFAAAGLAVLLYLAGLVFGAVRAPLGASLERRNLERYLARLDAGEEALARGDVRTALASFRDALYPHAPSSAAVARVVDRHHTGLVSRFIAVADEGQDDRVHLMALAKVDRLLAERRRLNERYLQARRRGGSAAARATASELRANTEALRRALARLSDDILAARSRPAVVYH